MAPVVRVERGWPWSHRWVRILPLICSVQMPLKRRASAGVAQAIQKAKRGRASSIAASGPALPDPTPPVSEAVIDNIADRVLARIEERLALRLMPPKAQPPPPTAVLPNLAVQAPLGPAVQNAVVSAPMTGQSVTTSHWASAKCADRDSALHVTGTGARSVPLAR